MNQYDFIALENIVDELGTLYIEGGNYAEIRDTVDEAIALLQNIKYQAAYKLNRKSEV